MNGKNIVWLAVAVVVIAGLAWFVKSKEQATWQSTPRGKPERVLPDFPLNDVTRIKVESKDKIVTVHKGANGWELVERENYPVNAEQVAAILRTFWDLKPVQVVEAGESQYPALEVAAPKAEKGGGILLEFDKDQTKLASVILGKAHQSAQGGGGPDSYPNGRYILAPDKKEIYVVTDSLQQITPDVVQWLSRDFIRIGNPKTVQVSGKDGVAWEIVKEKDSAEWKFVDAKEKEKVGGERTAGLLNAFSSFADVAGRREKFKEQFADARKVKVTDHDGFTYEIAIGAEKDGNRYVTVDVSADLPKERTAAAEEKPEDKARLDEEFKNSQEALKKRLENEKKLAEWVYLLPNSTLEIFFKQRSEMIEAEPPPEPAGEAGAGPMPGQFSPMQMPPPGPPVPAAPANP